MRTFLAALLVASVVGCGGGGPTHWQEQPLETIEGTFKGHTYSIEIPKGMVKGSDTYSDEYQYKAKRGDELYVFAPSISVGWTDKKENLGDRLKSEKETPVHQEQTADGHIAAFENSAYKGKEDYVVYAQRYVGEGALTCNARVYPMKKGENVKAKLLPLVQKMCLSLKAK
ncbi:MAG: hypothetical protein H0T42_09380 [Deltaproteobacteria bacterium]|nr:hypothetical protein [Deltaproteobacteria bacterium]